MTASTIRAWSFVHTWTSLVCTAFLLMLCVTGLPLIFHDEFEAALNPHEWTPANPDGPRLDLDTILDRALENRPGEVPLFMSFDTDRPVVNVTTGPVPDAPGSQMHFERFDATSGDMVPAPADAGGFMDFLLQFHTDMFLGLPGMLFLGAMGVAFLAAIISGLVLYWPFTRKQSFGVVRVQRSARVKWLDYHNLLGVVILAWVMVVGVTGVINTLATPIYDTWRSHALADLIAPYGEREVPNPDAMASLDSAVRRAVEAAPDMQLQFVAFPGGGFSTDFHYAIFLHGNSAVTEHLIAPVLVDAQTGEFAGLREMPWYVKMLSLSQPLHFGDYGGLPLKILWALLDIATIVVLVSGLYLWIARRRSSRRPLLAAAATRQGA
ncbi:MAG: iron uptake factor PiuB [Oceanicaulis sp. HLUCCA04]|nr:MAG: iron uptake factor PiuB [Oceanicaulis sp. HLUCCA04]